MRLNSMRFVVGISTLFGLILASPSLDFKPENSLAQEGSTTCPLPADIAVTFLKSKCEAKTLATSTTFYRYFSGDSNKYGRYLTTNLYKTNIEVIRKLALNQDWGNKATTLLEVTLPSGTTVYQGVVAPQTPASCYPGGGNQTFIQDSKDPNIKWVVKQALQVEPFSCP